MRVSRKCMIGAVLCMAVLPEFTSASVVYSDNFESDTVGSAPAGWTKGGGTSSFTISTVADSTAGGGSTQAMDLNETTTSSRYGLATFSDTTLNPGDSIQLSYDLWFTGTPPAADRLFRYGLYNSNTPPGAGGTGITARIGTGADAGTTYLDVYDSPKVFDVTTADGAKQYGVDKTDTPAIINDDNLRYITLSATLSADGMSMALSSAVYDASDNLLGSAGGTDTTLNDSTFTFNELAIGYNGTIPTGGADYRLDNVNVTYTSAPEPACLGLLTTIPVAMRRRRH